MKQCVCRELLVSTHPIPKARTSLSPTAHARAPWFVFWRVTEKSEAAISLPLQLLGVSSWHVFRGDLLHSPFHAVASSRMCWCTVRPQALAAHSPWVSSWVCRVGCSYRETPAPTSLQAAQGKLPSPRSLQLEFTTWRNSSVKKKSENTTNLS